MTRQLLLWDIDGTLLTTARAGIAAWEDALREVTGASISLETFPTAGLTDVEIAVRVLHEAHDGAEPEFLTQLLRRYETVLPSRLPARKGRVLPGVREILDDLAARSVPSLLLTGNTRAAAWAKLGHYGLSSYFQEGAFAEDGADRIGIARHAVRVGEAKYGPIPAHRIIVLGDTPHDVACGRAIGVRTIAVATGPYSVEALEACDPSCVIPQFPDPSTFARIVEDVMAWEG